MLTELRIENFAIIHNLELELSPGLSTFTGETGAGKSIILDAIEAVLGARTDVTSIRGGADHASIEAVFKLPPTVIDPVHAILAQEDLLDDDDSVLILSRHLRREGRHTARVNGRVVNSSLLRELGAFLVDIHGQSEHLSLLNTHHHLELLDRYADTGSLVTVFADVYHQLQKTRHQLHELEIVEQDAVRRADLLTYQVKEIEAAHLKAGEEEDLRQDRNRLSNSENLASLTQEAVQLLDEGTPEVPSITDSLGQVLHLLSNLVRIDPARTELLNQTENNLDALSDLGRDLRQYLESIEFNPRRLEQIEERLDLIHNLKRKYGGDIETILAFAADTKAQLDTISHAGERIAELKILESDLLKKLYEQGTTLSQKRQVAAKTMSRAVEQELADLRMGGTKFEVNFQIRSDPQGVPLPDGRQAACDATGLDRIEFLIAPNIGEGLKPLARIASGGETSRLMLAVKNVLAQADTISTLVFDEIDQGIGGRVGMVVGEKLWRLAHDHQVFCITHLPQLAAFGSHHYRVVKQVRDGRTSTNVEHLTGEERKQELAQMLGGVTDGTMKSVEEMLNAVAVKTNPLLK
jgi:DNA repair protein RecN (Recombination protein N)